VFSGLNSSGLMFWASAERYCYYCESRNLEMFLNYRFCWVIVLRLFFRVRLSDSS
jgi:hypothetical protein